MHKKPHLSILFCVYTIFFACLLLSSCIEEYSAKGVNEISGLLVVDGYITNGESVFTLRKSVGLTDEMYNEETVDKATLNIECSDGTILPGQFIEKGKYSVQVGDLHPNKEYRLNFSFDGEVYQSEYLQPVLTTAEIDTLFYTKEKEGKPVSIYISSHDPQNSSPYYHWKYTETWEVKAPFFANASEAADGTVTLYNLNSSNNIYYCWGRKESNSFLLESTEKLSENIIFQKQLIEIPCDHDKLSILYHVAITQVQIRKEAYTYFSMLRNTVEHTGGIFSPVLSAGQDGNIRCLTNPEIPVIGYMEVATVLREEMYIEYKKVYEAPETKCRALDPFYYNGFPWYQYGSTRAETKCIDCRSKENASKNKPDWWPTSHL